MNLFCNLKLRTKLALLLGLASVAVIAAIAAGATMLHRRMVADRIDSLHAVVDLVHSSARALEADVVAGRLTREQAVDRFRAMIYGMRYNGNEYVMAYTFDGTLLAHGTLPNLQGQSRLIDRKSVV